MGKTFKRSGDYYTNETLEELKYNRKPKLNILDQIYLEEKYLGKYWSNDKRHI